MLRKPNGRHDSFSSVTGPDSLASVDSRRGFLAALMAGATVVGIGGSIAGAAESDAKEAELPNLKGKFELRPNDSRDLYRVRVEMEVGGNIHVAKNPMASRDVAKKIPIKSDAVFDFEERFRRPENAAAGSVTTAAERFYHEAMSETTVNGVLQRLALRDEMRQALVRRDSLPETIYADGQYFSHNELELLRSPASSVDLDRLLPTSAVGMGDQFAPDKDAICGVLNLSSVQQTDVKLKVVALNEKIARFEMSGDVTGSVQGVPTSMKVVGKLTYDRNAKMCYWLAMAVRENREVGIAEPGFDVTAKIQMLRQPQAAPVAISKRPVSMQITRPVPDNQLLVELGSKELKVSALMDRRWRTMTDAPGRAMIRMVDNDRGVAQCDFRPLAALAKGRQWTLEAFKQDISKTLGNDVQQFIDAEQRLSDSGLRVLRITAQGTVQGVPVQWILLHFSDDSGRRMLASFTMDGDSIDQFGGSAVQLADSLRFVAPSAADQPTVEADGQAADVASRAVQKNSKR